jgi:hypothetical protein
MTRIKAIKHWTRIFADKTELFFVFSTSGDLIIYYPEIAKS